jgi:general secretion pathway protein I
MSREKIPFAEERRAGRQAGFSLLEVVVAFAILALGLGLLMRIFSQALSTTALSGTYSRAATLAEARLNGVGIEIPLEPGSYSGEPEEGLDWEVTIGSYDLGDVPWEPVVEPLLVTAEVYWDDARGRRRISLSTLMLGEPLNLPGLGASGIPAQQASESGAADR